MIPSVLVKLSSHYTINPRDTGSSACFSRSANPFITTKLPSQSSPIARPNTFALLGGSIFTFRDPKGGLSRNENHCFGRVTGPRGKSRAIKEVNPKEIVAGRVKGGGKMKRELGGREVRSGEKDKKSSREGSLCM